MGTAKLTFGYTQFVSAITFMHGSAAFFSKASIFLLYLQLFWVYTKMRIAIYVGLVVSLSFWMTIPAGIVTLVEFAPPMWTVHLLIAFGGISVFLDIYIFILPLPILFSLRLDLVKKVQLVAVFGTALV